MRLRGTSTIVTIYTSHSFTNFYEDKMCRYCIITWLNWISLQGPVKVFIFLGNKSLSFIFNAMTVVGNILHFLKETRLSFDVWPVLDKDNCFIHPYGFWRELTIYPLSFCFLFQGRNLVISLCCPRSYLHHRTWKWSLFWKYI